MTMDQIRYFLEVAYCKSFSTAAQNLYISQPNLTRYIAAMEKELGAKLFDRTTRKVELTEYGGQLMNRAEALFMPFLRSYEDLQEDIRQNRRAIFLGIARDENVPDAVLETVRDLNLAGEGLRYVPTYDAPDRLIEGLRNRRFHVIISSDRNARSIVDTEYVRLQPLKMLLAISGHHPLAAKEDLTLTDLRDELIFFCMPRSATTSEDIAQILFRRIGRMINVKLMDSHADVLRCVSVCAGAAILPDLAQTKEYPDIRFLPFEDRRKDEAAQAMVWRDDEQDPLVMKLVDAVRERIAT